ncbi:MAG: type II toxin-antitoxin system VapC family toxin [Candidatus Dormibacteraeota bacterium]|nr:type II toxin-antitoxin system VapC family toxin [Candidatus Dormibacteraeota bacterium]
MIYLDSAAIVKLVHPETRSADLATWLNTRTGVPLVSSALVEIEVPRAIRRSAPASLPGVPAALSRLVRLEIDANIRAAAASLSDPRLRGLDAIHLATAIQLGDRLEYFVTYDTRLRAHAEQSGLVVTSP